jgi:hypothetical protein
VPFVAQGDAVFRDSTIVVLSSAGPGGGALYSLVSGERPHGLVAFTRPFALRRTTTIRLGYPGATHEVTFHRVPTDRTIKLSAAYNRQYAAGGDDALIDGLHGGTNFRDGRWQGYQGTDLDAVIDLGKPRPVQGLSMRFLQDAWPWIFMPKRVEYAVSRDGTRWIRVGSIENTVGDEVTDLTIRDFSVEFAPTDARYVRARIIGHGPLPEWHPGRGSPSFFFTDELEVQ